MCKKELVQRNLMSEMLEMSEVRNGEGKKEIMGKIREKRFGVYFFGPPKGFLFFVFSLPPAYKTWEMLYF